MKKIMVFISFILLFGCSENLPESKKLNDWISFLENKYGVTLKNSFEKTDTSTAPLINKKIIDNYSTGKNCILSPDKHYSIDNIICSYKRASFHVGPGFNVYNAAQNVLIYIIEQTVSTSIACTDWIADNKFIIMALNIDEKDTYYATYQMITIHEDTITVELYRSRVVMKPDKD